MKLVKYLPLAAHLTLIFLFGLHVGITNLPYRLDDSDNTGLLIAIGVTLSGMIFFLSMFCHFLFIKMKKIKRQGLIAYLILMFVFFNYLFSFIYSFFLIAEDFSRPSNPSH